MVDEIQEEESSNNQAIGQEPSEDKSTMVSELFDCEARIFLLTKSWAGNNKEDAIAGRKFLNKQYSVLIGVINTTNSFTKKTGEELQEVLHRSVQAFICDLVNEPTIKHKDYRTLTFTFWHTLELFLGLPRNGHGANVLKDALAGLNTREESPTKKKGFLESLK
jgi:hypothetical protein